MMLCKDSRVDSSLTIVSVPAECDFLTGNVPEFFTQHCGTAGQQYTYGQEDIQSGENLIRPVGTRRKQVGYRDTIQKK